MTTDFVQVLKAWLHDPPSKALGVRSHEGRANRLLASVLDGSGEFRGFAAQEAGSLGSSSHDADVAAAVTERVPLPSAGPDGERAVGPLDGLFLAHPLSARPAFIDALELDPAHEEEACDDIRARLGEAQHDTRLLFLSLWRCLPDALAARATGWRKLPADTRQPDHTIWSHMDAAAAFATAAPRPAILSFSVGPVQSFIAAARTTRDLWSGSLLLSYLTFAAMRPVLEAFGPQSFVYPSCRGVPLIDKWLVEQGVPRDLVDIPDERTLCIPALPNRFVALVPADHREVEAQIVASVRAEWRRIADSVHEALSERWNSTPGWDAHWKRQIDETFEFRTTFLDRTELNSRSRTELVTGFLPENAIAVASLADAIPPEHRRYASHPPTWAIDLAIAAKIAQAGREIAHFDPFVVKGDVPPKCTMLGDYEVVGPSALEQSRAFWERAQATTTLGGFRLRKHERLSAPALVKRFWVHCHLRYPPEVTRIADTATIAARPWLERVGIDPDRIRKEHGDWSGAWIFRREDDTAPAPESPHDTEPDDRPPKEVAAYLQKARREAGEPARYYTVLHLDGDRLGAWLRGELMPSVREVLHPKLRHYFESLGQAAARGLAARRPLGPAVHAALSEALLTFSVHHVPEIVERSMGELVYSGGDDVLALLPVETVLSCAHELRSRYMLEHDDCGRLLMGASATVSAGLAVAHHGSSMRAAIEAARRAEQRAKTAGRNALAISVRRRSGEETEVVLPWDLVPELSWAVDHFRGGASDRWAYRLRSVIDALTEPNMFASELRRLLARSEGWDEVSARRAEALAARHVDAMVARGEPRPFEQACLLFQTASFLARGRDER